MVKPIVSVPQASLHQSSQPVTFAGPQLNRLIDDLVDTMRAAPGIGLAAPQIGINQRLAVLEYNPALSNDPVDQPIPLKILVNPVITHYSKSTQSLKEGCLSIPGVEVTVSRSDKIKVSSQTVNGDTVKIYASGLLARIIQHEIDHLNGVLIIDQAGKRKKI